MAPHVEDAEEREALRSEQYDVPVHQHQGGRRVLPGSGGAPSALAWTETEDLHRPTSPEENKRLLGAPELSPKSKVQAGLTLGVLNVPKRHRKCSHIPKTKPKVKTKFQKRKDKLMELLQPPYFILSLIVVTVCVHLVGSPSLGELMEWSPRAWCRQPWRLVSYGVVHASAAHLALNALVALVVGWRLEREQRWWRLFVVWAGGVLGGALGAGALQPTVHMVGASAGVYALLVAHLPNVALRYGHIPLWWFRPLSVLVLSASEGCSALLRPQHWEPPLQDEYRVAWSAHALGALVGIPVGFLAFTGENSGHGAVVACRVVSAALLAGGLVAAGLYYGGLEND